jgi:hypothetical protein
MRPKTIMRAFTRARIRCAPAFREPRFHPRTSRAVGTIPAIIAGPLDHSFSKPLPNAQWTTAALWIGTAAGTCEWFHPSNAKGRNRLATSSGELEDRHPGQGQQGTDNLLAAQALLE